MTYHASAEFVAIQSSGRSWRSTF